MPPDPATGSESAARAGTGSRAKQRAERIMRIGGLWSRGWASGSDSPPGERHYRRRATPPETGVTSRRASNRRRKNRWWSQGDRQRRLELADWRARQRQARRSHPSARRGGCPRAATERRHCRRRQDACGRPSARGQPIPEPCLSGCHIDLTARGGRICTCPTRSMPRAAPRSLTRTLTMIETVRTLIRLEPRKLVPRPTRT